MSPAQPAGTYVNFGYTPQIDLLYCDRRRLVRWNAVRSRVPYWRLYWNDRPGACLWSDAARYPLEPAWFTLVAPNTCLSSSLSRPVEHFHTHFTVGLPYAFVTSTVHRFPARPWLLRLMRSYHPLYGTPVADTPRRAAAALALCWYALWTLPPRLLETPNADPRLTDLLRWWEAQDWRACSNREMADRLHLDPAAFCRLFKQRLGQPPHVFGLHKRVERACLLLRFSDSSIKDIAARTGFYDRYHFSRVFKRIMRATPAVFRAVERSASP